MWVLSEHKEDKNVCSVIENPEVSGNDFVFQNRSRRNVDPVSGVCDDDDGSAERNASAEHHVAGHRQVVQLQDVRNRSKSLQKLSNLNYK